MSSQTNIAIDGKEEQSTEDVRNLMQTASYSESRGLNVGGDDHALADMDSKRQAPIESVAKNVVRRYDVVKAFVREYIANSHTACIQRAKWMIANSDRDIDVNMNNVRAVLDVANDLFGYEPVIVVKRNKNPNARWGLKIEDNGIGIDSKTAYAIRDIGVSGWHMDGSTNGRFGQGTMSGFLPVDTYGEFHMTTKSAVTGENYRAAWTLTEIDDLKGKRDSVGTTFTFPVLTEEAKDIDYYQATQEYSSGMIIPVLYEEYDEDGNETQRSDEFLPEFMEDDYDDDALVITYEDDFGKAVWSPSGSSYVDTYCGYQPINRNDSGWSTQKFEMPSVFDFRLKVEDGSIIEVNGNMDHDLVGKTPISDSQYTQMLLSDRNVCPEFYVDDEKAGYMAPESSDAKYVTDDRVVANSMRNVEYDSDPDGSRVVIGGKFEGRPIVSDTKWYDLDHGRIGDEFVKKSDIDDDLDVLVAMEPTDDRDRFEQKHVDDVLRRYSEKLWDKLRQRTGEVFQSVDTFDDVFELEGNEQALFHDGISRFGPNYSRSTAATVKQQIQESLGADLPEEVCAKISVMMETVSWAPRHGRRVNMKKNRTTKPVWKIIRKSGESGDVYMTSRITKRKANLAWELDENNHVIQTSPGNRQQFREKLGWKDLTDLPSGGFESEFPDHDFDQSFLESWDRELSDSSSSSSSSNTMDDEITSLSLSDERAMKRNVKVRIGAGDPYNMYTMNGERLFEALDTDEEAHFRGDAEPIKNLVLYRQTEHSASVGVDVTNRDIGTYYAVVPNYVYDYLIKAEQSCTEDEYKEMQKNKVVEFDWTAEDESETQRTITDLTNRDVIVMARPGDLSTFEEYGVMDEVAETIEAEMKVDESIDDDESINSITEVSNIIEYHETLSRSGCVDYNVDDGPTIVSLTRSVGSQYGPTVTVGYRDLFYDSVLYDLDRDAPEWNYFDVDVNDSDMVESMVRLMEAGGFVSTDDEFELGIEDNDHTKLDRRSYGNVTMDKVSIMVTKTLERLEDAGGFVESDDE